MWVESKEFPSDVNLMLGKLWEKAHENVEARERITSIAEENTEQLTKFFNHYLPLDKVTQVA